MEADDCRSDLERFVFDNPDLERLEAILDDFNPFVALRWTRQEARHSSCLRWLLDPAETHGLGAYFLRAFLKRLARGANTGDSPTVVDVDSAEYENTDVLQEWNGIDILVRDDGDAILAVLENKIDSSEHSHQLQRYRELVERHFPNHRRLFAYLTIDGRAPSDDAYSAVSYSEVIDLIRDTVSRRGDQLSPEVRAFLTQYLEMLRRHIVEDSEIQETCRRIYHKHRRALDVLFEHRPDRVSMISDYLRSVIDKDDDLLADHCSKSYIRFIPKNLDFLPRLGEGWTSSKRLILFEFDNSAGYLQLKAILGPGAKTARQAIHKFIADRPEVFNRAESKLYPRWWSFHSERWIAPKPYAEAEVGDLKDQILKRFERFKREDLPSKVASLQELRGLQLGAVHPENPIDSSSG